ncbi:MAG: 3-phosphoshikimate 1-carboxyvinyltransferase [Candidatus Nitrosopolaris sp.]
MVRILITKSRINGIIRCPSSKSYSHRAIAIASLVDGESTIKNPLLSRDTLATISACKALGVITRQDNFVVHIKGRHSFAAPENVVNAENSGTTIRLMTTMSALVRNGLTVLTGDESLRKRPMQPLLDALGKLGVQAYSTKMDGTAPLIVRGGGIKGGTTAVDGGVSSQFVSSLLISCVYADSAVVITTKGRQVSKPYIESTLATMNAFGVKVHNEGFREYHLPSASYTPTTFDVPSDLSSAALILTAGLLLGDELTVTGIKFFLPQADSDILDIIKKMGGKIKVNRQKGEIRVYGTEQLCGGDFDLSDTPDLLPVVSTLALKARSPVKITGIGHARLKETDRVANIASQLTKLGATIKEEKNELLISAPKNLKNASLEAFNDHRLFMAFTIVAMLTKKSTVAGVESVDVSYPNFIQDIIELGGNIKLMPDRE